MYVDYDPLNGCSELTEQEWVGHEFIELFMNDDEIASVAVACHRWEDVILSQPYFARAKRDGDTKKLDLLSKIVEDRLRIKGRKLGIPEFVFFRKLQVVIGVYVIRQAFGLHIVSRLRPKEVGWGA